MSTCLAATGGKNCSAAVSYLIGEGVAKLLAAVVDLH